MCKQVSVSLPYRGDSHDDQYDDYTPPKTEADCEAGSAAAGGAVTLPAGRRRLVRRRRDASRHGQGSERIAKEAAPLGQTK